MGEVLLCGSFTNSSELRYSGLKGNSFTTKASVNFERIARMMRQSILFTVHIQYSIYHMCILSRYRGHVTFTKFEFPIELFCEAPKLDRRYRTRKYHSNATDRIQTQGIVRKMMMSEIFVVLVSVMTMKQNYRLYVVHQTHSSHTRVCTISFAQLN